VDFLGREPDAPGLALWADDTNSCGADAGCRAFKRVGTSAAFFLPLYVVEFGGDYVSAEVFKAFTSSDEYRKRFAQ
jgi:hypothetical protein